MKTFFLHFFVFSGVSITVFSQPLLFNEKQEIPVPFERKNYAGLMTDGNISEWYNYGQTIYDMGGDVSFFRNFLFPDSTVQVEYTSGMGYVWKHSLGQVFDPASVYFSTTNTVLDSTVSYTLDSVGFFYRYFRFRDSVPDTLIIQIYENNKINFAPNPWNNGKSYARVPYNYQKRKGAVPSHEYVYLLTDSDTISTDAGFLTFPVNVSVPAGKKIAATITYFPGHSYSVGDTIDAYVGKAPFNKVNAFVAYDFSDNDKNPDQYFYNNMLTASKNVRYNMDTTGWNGKYIPGTAWNSGIYHLDMAFKITTQNLGITEKENLNKSFCFYPGLGVSGEKISIILSGNDFADEGKLSFYDITGRKLFSERIVFNGNKSTLAIPDLAVGMYLVVLDLGMELLTKKIVVNDE